MWNADGQLISVNNTNGVRATSSVAAMWVSWQLSHPRGRHTTTAAAAGGWCARHDAPGVARLACALCCAA